MDTVWPAILPRIIVLVWLVSIPSAVLCNPVNATDSVTDGVGVLNSTRTEPVEGSGVTPDALNATVTITVSPPIKFWDDHSPVGRYLSSGLPPLNQQALNETGTILIEPLLCTFAQQPVWRN